MEHVVTRLSEPLRAGSGGFTVHMVPAWRDNLVWLLTPEGSDTAYAVDGPEAEAVIRACDRLGRRLAGILTTHTHPDHIGLHRDLAKAGRLDGLRVFGAADSPNPIPGLTHPVEAGDTVSIEGIAVRVLRTEGHQNAHMSYLADDVLFCGDTLFAGGCGYLFDGPPQAMFDSLLRLAALPGDTHVCCAHEYTQDNLKFAWMIEPDNAALGERIRRVWALRAEGRCTIPSTIEEERSTNPFLRPGSPRLQAELAARLPDADLSSHAAIFAATRQLKDRKDHSALSDAELPLR